MDPKIELYISADKIVQNSKYEALRNQKTIKVSCQKCKKIFLNKYNLESHLRLVHRSKPHKCTKCPQQFDKKFQLKFHDLSDHLNLKPEEIKKFFKNRVFYTSKLIDIKEEEIDEEILEQEEIQEDFSKQRNINSIKKNCQDFYLNVPIQPTKINEFYQTIVDLNNKIIHNNNNPTQKKISENNNIYNNNRNNNRNSNHNININNNTQSRPQQQSLECKYRSI